MIIDAKKNEAFELVIPMLDSTTPTSFKTGVSVVDTAYYKDGAGAWTSLAITDTFLEVGATGLYQISLTAAEMNHDWVIIKCTVSGAADSAVSFRLHTKLVDDLNDLAATAIVSDGTALNTTAGDLDLVTLVATTTTNTDMLAATAIVSDGTALNTTAGDLDLVTLAATTTTATNVTTVNGLAANVITTAAINDGAIAAAEIAGAACDKIADHIVRRTYANVRASSDGDTVDDRSLLGAIAGLVNKVDVSSGTDLIKYHEDDTTAFVTTPVTTSGAANPITVMDPP